MNDDIRRHAPKEWLHQLDDAIETLLPTAGQVRGSSGLVHAIVGDHTLCDIQWAAYSRKEERTLPLMGWRVTDESVSCFKCLVEP